MRITIVETAAFGGLLHYAVQLADALAERGHEVDVLAPRDNELADRAGAARMRAVLASPVGPDGHRRGGRAGIALQLARSWARIVGHVTRRRPDWVILNMDIDLTPVAAAANVLDAVRGRTKLAVVAHSVRPLNRWGGEEHFATSRPLLRTMGRLYARADLVLVHGERSRAEAEEHWPGSRTAQIPHGDETLFGTDALPPSDEEHVLFFGTWRKTKGLPVLMDAFDRLAERRPGATLTIAGAPTEISAEQVATWAARHPGRVEVIADYVANEDVPALVRRARVVAVPYLTAYQSGVVHVAMTLGRAVVATDVGDLPEAVLHERTGLIVPPGDVAALETALDRIVGDPDLAARYGAEGHRRSIEDASWPAVAEVVEARLEAA